MPARRPTRTARRGAAPRRAPRRLRSPPRGFHSVTPYLAVEGGTAALEFYKRAFGARELIRRTTLDGRLVHGRLQIGDSLVMVSDVFPGSPADTPGGGDRTRVTLHIYSKDVDQLWSRAIAAGARVLMPLDNQFWGERYGQLIDPFGHRWSVSTPISMSAPERARKEAEAIALISGGAPPKRSGDGARPESA